MCLVFIGIGIDSDHPVMIGANREESRQRPTTSQVCCRQRSVRALLAGADHGPDGSFPSMGTWLGVNEAGLAVAVTNRRDGELPWKDQVRSRGLLVVSLLGFTRAEKAVEFARDDLSQGGYGGCNYLIAGPDAAFVVHAPGERRISVCSLQPGVHAITSLDLDDPEDPRIRIVHENLNLDRFVTTAERLCRDDRIVISGKDRGTVSSSLIVIGAEIAFHHLLGDPRKGDYHIQRLTRRL